MVLYYLEMSQQEKNPIQVKLDALQKKRWTLAALADAIGLKINTLEKWKAGQRNPANETAVLAMLELI